MVGKPAARRRAWSVGALVLAVAAATACSSTPDAGTTSGAPSSGTTAATATSAADSSVCGYYYEWKSAWKFALQPDPHAAYSYVIPKVTTEPVAYQITGDFPYAPWTSWTIYNAEAQPFSLATDSKITPDAA
jgi:hypothetical protein